MAMADKDALGTQNADVSTQDAYTEKVQPTPTDWTDVGPGMTEAQKAAYWFDLYLEETSKRRQLERELAEYKRQADGYYHEAATAYDKLRAAQSAMGARVAGELQERGIIMPPGIGKRLYDFEITKADALYIADVFGILWPAQSAACGALDGSSKK